MPTRQQPADTAARFGVGWDASSRARRQVVVARGCWGPFLGILGWPCLAQVSDPVVVCVGVTTGCGPTVRIPGLAATQSTPLLRLPGRTYRQWTARVISTEFAAERVSVTAARAASATIRPATGGPATIDLTAGVCIGVLRVGPPQVLLVPRPSRRHYACYS